MVTAKLITNPNPQLSISVNDTEHCVSVGTTVSQLIDQLQQAHFLKSQTGFALARNESVIPKACWSDTVLEDKDQILIIIPTQGG